MRRALLALFLAFFFCSPAQAAELTARIKGIVADAGGGPVPGATVAVSSDALQGDRAVITDADGRFIVAALPVGTYDVTVTLPGFTTAVSEDLDLSVGATQNLLFTITPVEASGEIVVSAERPILDTESVQAGLSLDSDKLKDLPSAGRSYHGATAMAPGAVGSGNSHIRGGMDNQDQFYIDGVNITDPVTNTFSMNMNYDAIEEVQVITGGMDAEYGRALGGAVNIVTKSGSNQLEGSVYVQYADERFKVYPPIEGIDQPDLDDYSDSSYVLNLGGPIVKDKVWFFVSGQMDISKRTTVIDNEEIGRPDGNDPITGDPMSSMPVRDWRSRYVFGKVTMQPLPQHRMWLHAQADPTHIVNVAQDPYTLPSGEAVQDQGGWLGSFGHIWMLGQDATLETQLSTSRSYINYYSVLWLDCKNTDDYGGCTDDFGAGWYAADANGFSYGEIPYGVFDTRERSSANTALSLYPHFMGSHRIKLGVNVEMLKTWSVYPGVDEDGLDYYSHNGDPTDLDGYSPSFTYRYDSNFESTLTGTMASAYLQDVWNPTDRLTLRPGVRVDRPALKDDEGNVVFQSLAFSPRFGAAFDLTGNGTTVVHGYYGRFVDPGYLTVSSILMKRSQGGGSYNWSAQDNDWSSEPSSTWSSGFLAHDDLKPPTSDAIDLGVRHAFGDHTMANLTYSQKRARGFWEDDEVNLIWNEEGTDVIGGRNGSNESIYRLRTSDSRFYEYDSVEVSMVHEWPDLGWMGGSYVWSQAYGNNDDQGATILMDNTAQIPYETGYLSYDRTHALKLYGTFRRDAVTEVGPVRLGYLSGWNFRMYSGSPYRPLHYNNYNQGWTNYGDERAYRLPAFSQTDLKGGLVIGVGPTQFELIAECFNVFNDRSVVDVNTIYGNKAGDGVEVDADGEPLFGTPLEYQSPRYFRVAVRGEF